MANTFEHTFEGGNFADGTGITAANSGNAPDTIFQTATKNTGVTLNYSTAWSHRGTHSFLATWIANAAGYLAWTTLAPPSAGTRVGARCYVTISAFNNGGNQLLQLRSASAQGSMIGTDSSGRFVAINAAGSTIGNSPAFSLNTTYRLEQYITPGAGSSTGTIETYIYLGDSTTPWWSYVNSATNANTSAITQVRFGQATGSQPAATVAYDDCYAIDDIASGLIGPSIVVATTTAEIDNALTCTVAASSSVTSTGSTTIASESFGTPGSGWPAQWTTGATGGATFSVASGVGQMVEAASAVARAELHGTSLGSDQDLYFTFSAPDVSGLTVAAVLQSDGSRLGVTLLPTNALVLEITATLATLTVRSGNLATAGSSGINPGLVNGTQYRVRYQRSGSTIRFKLWTVGSSEPGSWSDTLTDAGVASMASGYPGVAAYSTTSTTVSFDDIAVTIPSVGFVSTTETDQQIVGSATATTVMVGTALGQEALTCSVTAVSTVATTATLAGGAQGAASVRSVVTTTSSSSGSISGSSSASSIASASATISGAISSTNGVKAVLTSSASVANALASASTAAVKVATTAAISGAVAGSAADRTVETATASGAESITGSVVSSVVVATTATLTSNAAGSATATAVAHTTAAVANAIAGGTPLASTTVATTAAVSNALTAGEAASSTRATSARTDLALTPSDPSLAVVPTTASVTDALTAVIAARTVLTSSSSTALGVTSSVAVAVTVATTATVTGDAHGTIVEHAENASAATIAASLSGSGIAITVAATVASLGGAVAGSTQSRTVASTAAPGTLALQATVGQRTLAASSAFVTGDLLGTVAANQAERTTATSAGNAGLSATAATVAASSALLGTGLTCTADAVSVLSSTALLRTDASALATATATIDTTAVLGDQLLLGTAAVRSYVVLVTTGTLVAALSISMAASSGTPQAVDVELIAAALRAIGVDVTVSDIAITAGLAPDPLIDAELVQIDVRLSDTAPASAAVLGHAATIPPRGEG